MGDWSTEIDKDETPMRNCVWLGNAQDNGKWRECKARLKAERGAKCEQCGSTQNLDLHHRQARKDGGKSTINNAELLCRHCHILTPSYGARCI